MFHNVLPKLYIYLFLTACQLKYESLIPFLSKLSIINRLSENASFLKFTHNYKGNTIAKVKIDDIIMSKNENHKPKPH